VLLQAPAHAATPAADAGAAPGSGLGGFKADSEASGVDLLYNDGSEVNVTVPDAESSYATGVGHALAADLYPGPVAGNPGATIKQFLGANLPASIIDPLSTLQDNYKAEAYSGGPNDSSFPAGGPAQALSDIAHADDAGSKAVGTLVNAGLNVSATATTTLGVSSVTSTALSSVSDLTLAGLIHIGKVTSTATASSDGTTGKGSALTVISGLTVAGQSISVNASGISVGPAKVPLDAASLVNTALKSLGITMKVSPTDRVVNGAQVVEHAPALTIFFNLPSNGGNTFTLILGGAAAEANASAAYVAPPLGSTPPVAVGVGSGSSGGLSSGGGTGFTSTGIGSTSAPTNDSQSAFAPPVTSAPAPTRSLGLIPAAADFKGLGAGALVLGLVLAGAAAFGMGKMPDDVLAEKAAATSCPLERSSP
jgi:hypothetical protein